MEAIEGCSDERIIAPIGTVALSGAIQKDLYREKNKKHKPHHPKTPPTTTPTRRQKPPPHGKF